MIFFSCIYPNVYFTFLEIYWAFAGSWYIASGYLEDLLELLQHFENVKSWRFSAFSSCWREMKFSLIYRYYVYWIDFFMFPFIFI